MAFKVCCYGLHSYCEGVFSEAYHGVQMNKPFPSFLKPLFQSEAKCEAIDPRIIFYSLENKSCFRQEGFALTGSLVLKAQVLRTGRWPVKVFKGHVIRYNSQRRFSAHHSDVGFL